MNSNDQSQLKSSKTPKWLLIILTITVVNFFSFMAIDIYLGGDALNGKQENGKFYLGNHGRYKEVSEQIFEYSKIHGYSMFAANALFLFSAGMYYLREKKDK